VIEGLVLPAMAVCVTFDAVIVALGCVLSVTVKFFVPPAKAAFAGRTAVASLDVSLIVSFVLIRFQFASTALTVTENARFVISSDGVPVLPVPEPGAAASPGTSNCSFANAPALTVVVEPVEGAFVPSVISVAVTLALPPVFSVTANVFVPAARAPFPGRTAFASLEVIPTVCVRVFTRFQLLSTAFTVTLKAVPEIWLVGVPVFPVTVPGAADSPGINSCNLLKAPALMLTAGLVFAVTPTCVRSDAVMARFPEVTKVALNIAEPATSAVSAGSVAFASLDAK